MTATKQPAGPDPPADPAERGRRLRWLLEPLAIDLRSLALFRVATSAVLLYNLLGRLVDLQAMYSDQGMMPLQVVSDHYASSWRWSLHLLSGSVTFQGILFAVAVILALALLVGFQTRLACVGSWLLLASLHTRAPLLVSGGDVLLSMMLFWGMFLPLGACASCDVLRGAGPIATGRRVLSVASAAILLQVALMYWITGAAKWNEIWLQGQAIQNALNYGALARPLGQFLLHYPGLLRLLTFATLALELLGPFLLFSPWFNRYTRPLALIGFIALHLGIALTMRVVIFSEVCLAALALFLPAQFWDSRWINRTLLAVKRHLPWFSSRTPVTRHAPRRRLPPAWSSALSRIRAAVCMFFLAYIVLYDIGWLVAGDRFFARLPGWLNAVSDLAVIGQRWSMFMRPADVDWRYVALARCRDASLRDVLHGGRSLNVADLERPWDLPARFRNQRWMLAFRELTEDRNFRFRQSVAEYLYRDWNQRHGNSQQIDLLDLLFIEFMRPAEEDLPPMLVRQTYGRVDALALGGYRHGLRHGHWVFRHPNGTKSAEGSYREGKEEGRWVYWFEDGRIQSAGSYVNGQFQGRWTFWYKDGTRRNVTYDQSLILSIEQ